MLQKRLYYTRTTGKTVQTMALPVKQRPPVGFQRVSRRVYRTLSGGAV